MLFSPLFFFLFSLSLCIQIHRLRSGSRIFPTPNYGFSKIARCLQRHEEKPQPAGDRSLVLGLGDHLRLHQPPPAEESQGKETLPLSPAGAGGTVGRAEGERGVWLPALPRAGSREGDGEVGGAKLAAAVPGRVSAPRTVLAAPRSGAERRGGTAERLRVGGPRCAVGSTRAPAAPRVPPASNGAWGHRVPVFPGGFFFT